MNLLGDTIHLSNIDMIAGTPVLDIKPYIPEYDSPHTRIIMDSEPYDPNTPQSQATTVSLDEVTDACNLSKDSEMDVSSYLKCERTDENNEPESLFSRDASEDAYGADSSRAVVQFPLSTDLHNVLEDVKAYVTQTDLCKVSWKSEDQVSDSPKTKLPESTVDQPCYGEEYYSTIASWIREPPVGSLEVRFTPHAQKELAEFLPTHLSGKFK